MPRRIPEPFMPPGRSTLADQASAVEVGLPGVPRYCAVNAPLLNCHRLPK
jgi:hypothetical protein